MAWGSGRAGPRAAGRSPPVGVVGAVGPVVRRRVRDDGRVPDRLASFTPDEWPATDVEDAYLLFVSARRGWYVDNVPGAGLFLFLAEHAERIEGRGATSAAAHKPF